MNLVKIGAGALITVVLVLVGLNQYESYKITKKANNAIEAIEKNVKSEMSKQKAITNLISSASSIRSAIVTERQERLIKGDSTFINSLSSGNDELFDKILGYPLKAGTSQGEWSIVGENSYDYHLGNYESISFKYDNQNGRFECINNCSLFPY